MKTAHEKLVRSAWDQKRPVLQFTARFVMYIICFYAFTATSIFREHFFPAYLELNATAAAVILRVLGEEANAIGNSIVSPRVALAIMRGCDAIEPAALFVAATLAFPAPPSLRSRLLVALIGAALLIVINLFRIVSLYFVRAHFPSAFDLLHVDVWQALFVFLVMLLWLAWAMRMVDGRITSYDGR